MADISLTPLNDVESGKVPYLVTGNCFLLMTGDQQVPGTVLSPLNISSSDAVSGKLPYVERGNVF